MIWGGGFSGLKRGRRDKEEEKDREYEREREKKNKLIGFNFVMKIRVLMWSEL